MRFFLVSMILVAGIALGGLALAQEEIVFKNYNLKHISLKDPETRQKVQDALHKIVSPDAMSLDTRSNSIFVRAIEAKQNEVARVIARLDVGGPKKTTATITRSVTAVSASDARRAVEEAAKKDEQLKGIELSHSDDTRKVVMTGTAEQLEKAKAIIDALEAKGGSGIVTKVYKVKNRSASSLASIVKLHLAGRPGTGVAVDDITNSLIVRETEASHAKVKEVTEKFDTQLATLILQFRVIYASREGTGVDDSIKDIARELKEMFDFTSYRALEAPTVKVEQGHSAEVEDSGSGMSVSLARCDYDPETGKIRIERLRVSKKMERKGEKPTTLTIRTTIKTDSGHTVVIGGTASKNAKDALIVAVKATVEK